jgi:hypothetical protein
VSKRHSQSGMPFDIKIACVASFSETDADVDQVVSWPSLIAVSWAASVATTLERPFWAEGLGQ